MKSTRRWVFPAAALAFGMAGASVMSGCATPPPASDTEATAEFRQTNDPLEPANRVTYQVNEAVDKAVLEPVAKGYRDITPQPVRTGIHNVLANAAAPVVFANDVLQGKPARAGDTFMRFMINSTAGVAGIFDVAREMGYGPHESGFGTTLALWGVDDGPYLYLPLFGPSNPRDAVGLGGDIVLDPMTWISAGTVSTAIDYTRFGVGALDTRAQFIEPIDQIRKTALDPYATFRSLSRQNRDAEIQAVKDEDHHTVPVWFPQPPPPAAPAAAPAR